ncbi:MAG: hypothetical protein HYZ29_31970 [Myxococcales bacterium]|nr:hypothetical protein [Myxococcales bacterium]
MSTGLRYAFWLIAGLGSGLSLTGGCGGDTDGDGSAGTSTGGAGSCTPGETRTCVGPGACQGGQLCGANGSWGSCDCGAGGAGGSAGSAGGSTGGAGGGAGAGGNAGGGASDAGDGSAGADAGCTPAKTAVTIARGPADIIWLVDNSCSMAEEMKAIQDNLNPNFAQALGLASIDFRIIVVGEHGGYNTPSSYESSICIEPPLGGKPCAGVGQNVAPTNNLPIFFHYDHDDVESTDGWCKLLEWFDDPDRYNLAPKGWSEWLRADAFKTFVLVSDDGMNCTWPYVGTYPPSCATNGPKCYKDGVQSTSATEAPIAAKGFDADLLALSPTQFGTAQTRKYMWHSLSGVAPNFGSSSSGYLPSDPLVPYSTKCTTAVNSGPGTQALSMLTGGLRFPVCDGAGFPVAFKQLANAVIQSALPTCEHPLPSAGSLATLELEYAPPGGGQTVHLSQVKDQASCKASAFYLSSTDAGAKTAVFCPDACKQLRADKPTSMQALTCN